MQKAKVAIIDDNTTMRERFADYMLMEGYDPIVFDRRLNSVNNLLVEANTKGIQFGIFDHRLTERHFADFLGAEGVSAFNHNLKASILVTGYENDDSETSIRKYRRGIPVLLHMSEVNSSKLSIGLIKTYQEIVEKKVPIERQSCRSILTIVDIIKKGNVQVVKVIVSQWNPKEQIGFPFDMLPGTLRGSISIGKYLMASVNVDATRAEDIFFDNFELPNPKVLDGL
jgi:FixJ family two-component response regulator